MERFTWHFTSMFSGFLLIVNPIDNGSVLFIHCLFSGDLHLGHGLSFQDLEIKVFSNLFKIEYFGYQLLQ